MSGAVYSFWRAIEGKKELSTNNRLPKNQAEYLLQGNNMHGLVLGQALDSCRWGSMQTCMWEMDVRGMISFIQIWMEQNKNLRKKITDGLHERKLEKLYTKFELPHLDKKCVEEHKKKLEFKGITYCGEYATKELDLTEIITSEDPYTELKLKDFFDKNPTLTNLLRKTYEESESIECDSKCKEDCESDHGYIIVRVKDRFDWHTRRKPGGDYTLDFEFELDEELGPYWEQIYNEEIKKLKEQFPTTEITPCRGILSDKGKTLSLETILNRLNINPVLEKTYCKDNLHGCDVYKEEYHCNGHNHKTNKIEFTCDGWDIAFYVQRWMEQVPKGEAPIFETEEEKEISKVYPKYIPQYAD